jgi:pentatricopeptide repeat protein
MSGLLKASSRRHSKANLPKALELWSGLRVAARATRSPLPESAMHVGIHTLCRAGRTKEAYLLVEELNKRGEPPGVKVCLCQTSVGVNLLHVCSQSISVIPR